ncbi:MAG: L-histidine N(alpha)-methyltransferase [Stackebrandtia sp.]
MNRSADAPRVDRRLTPDDLLKELASDVRAGLSGTRKHLPPKHFYDARGSRLFEDITRLPEYYPTRAERAILTERAGDVASLADADTLVELGSGSSEKTRLLLDGMTAAGVLRRYIPVDVSADALIDAIDALRSERPSLDVHGVVADVQRHLHLLPSEGRRLVAFLGGTVGNFAPDERRRFFSTLRATLRGTDAFLLGVDLVKDPQRLVAAYDDSAGVTAEFNRNVLHVINRRLGADFAPDTFDHVAVWDAAQEHVEMRLRAVRECAVHVRELGITVRLKAGEEIRTEISAKFRRDGLAAELRAARFSPVAWWTDPSGDFALCLTRPF